MLFYRGTNSKSGKIYLIATMKYTWCAYLSSLLTSINHYDFKKNLTLLPCLFMPLLAVSMITLIMLNHIIARFEFQFIYLLYLIFFGFFFLFAWHLGKPYGSYCIQKTKISWSINDSFAGWSQSMVTIVNLIDKLHADLANWSVL